MCPPLQRYSTPRALFGDRCAGGRPHLGKGLFYVRCGRTAQDHASVAPGFDSASGISDPAFACAQPGDERNFAVDAERFAVIAAEPTEWAVELKRVEAAHLRSGIQQRRPKSPAHARPKPIVENTHADSAARSVGKRADHFAADGVIADDVVLEIGFLFGRPDCSQPRRKILVRILEDADAVAGNQRRAGGAQQRLVSRQAQRGAGCCSCSGWYFGHVLYACSLKALGPLVPLRVPLASLSCAPSVVE